MKYVCYFSCSNWCIQANECRYCIIRRVVSEESLRRSPPCPPLNKNTMAAGWRKWVNTLSLEFLSVLKCIVEDPLSCFAKCVSLFCPKFGCTSCVLVGWLELFLCVLVNVCVRLYMCVEIVFDASPGNWSCAQLLLYYVCCVRFLHMVFLASPRR